MSDEFHSTLKTKAAEQGLTLSDYLLQTAEREAEQVSWEEMRERVLARPRRSVGTAVEDIIREARGPLPE